MMVGMVPATIPRVTYRHLIQDQWVDPEACKEFRSDDSVSRRRRKRTHQATVTRAIRQPETKEHVCFETETHVI